MSTAIFKIVKALEHAGLHFYLERTRPDTIRISATLVGERWEIDVFEDDHVEVSRFLGNEAVEGGIDFLLHRLEGEI
jgi:hypothetical protein